MANTNPFSRAERKQVKLRVGLIGPSGSGKTYSSLRLARGIGGKTALIDTESRRSLYYAADFPDFSFDVLHLDPPFEPERYIQAITEAEKHGYEIIIVDSASHEWNGKGGILDTKDRMPDKSEFTKWAKLTPRHNAFLDKIIRSTVHLILTIRGKDVYVLEEDTKGRQVPKKIGLGGEQRAGFEYELTCSFMIDTHSHVAAVEKDNTHIFTDGLRATYEVLTEEHGKRLLQWAESGAIADKTDNIYQPTEPIQEHLPEPEASKFTLSWYEQKMLLHTTVQALNDWQDEVRAEVKKHLSYEDQVELGKRFRIRVNQLLSATQETRT